MCRLYGFLANEPTKVDCSLVFAQNALLLQSRVDEAGRDNADGWGIGTYEDGVPRLYKNPIAAFNDHAFGSTAEKVYSRATVAHVRKATVGTPSLQKTHPFSVGQFIFAHNGTVTGFESIRAELAAETDPRFQAHCAGKTDSEQYFLWLLTRLKQQNGLQSEDLFKADAACDRLLIESVEWLAQRCLLASPNKTPRLNFVLTDGRSMFACRWDNSLHLLFHEGIYNCKICGIPHIHHHESVNHRAVAVASEPITDDDWQEFPNRTVRSFNY